MHSEGACTRLLHYSPVSGVITRAAIEAPYDREGVQYTIDDNRDSGNGTIEGDSGSMRC